MSKCVFFLLLHALGSSMQMACQEDIIFFCPRGECLFYCSLLSLLFLLSDFFLSELLSLNCKGHNSPHHPRLFLFLFVSICFFVLLWTLQWSHSVLLKLRTEHHTIKFYFGSPASFSFLFFFKKKSNLLCNFQNIFVLQQLWLLAVFYHNYIIHSMKTKASEQFSFSATLTSAVAIASSVHLK